MTDTQAEIRRKRKLLDEQMYKTTNDLMLLKDTCTHPDATHVNKADTGNWCRDDDQYWTEHYCPDCKHHWSTEQNWKPK